ncbi:hypothetical protein [Lysobacter enzymogenes]|uniref:hypothetical protein n=1 Tax=Lysobacter enzymogenes TaxID=69 RepID=UPI001AF4940F|nr:hypothetical protein [Lysobacter enzymogenes]QQQ02891.1 hypothetical protein JHW41_07995 [Lysobacter enzymogenes]
MIARGGRARPAVLRLRGLAAAAIAALILAACSQAPPPTEFPGGIAIPAAATDVREHIDDQLRTMTAYYRFDLPPAQLPALVVALHCRLGDVGHGARAAERGDPAWYAPRPDRAHRRCESRIAHWMYELDVDVSRPDRYTVYLSASS